MRVLYYDHGTVVCAEVQEIALGSKMDRIVVGCPPEWSDTLNAHDEVDEVEFASCVRSPEPIDLRPLQVDEQMRGDD